MTFYGLKLLYLAFPQKLVKVREVRNTPDRILTNTRKYLTKLFRYHAQIQSPLV